MKLPIESTYYSDPEAKFTVYSRSAESSGIQGYFKSMSDARIVASYLIGKGHTNVTIERNIKVPYLSYNVKMTLIVVSTMLAVFGALCLTLATMDGLSCYSKWKGTEYKTEYGVFSGCRIQVNGIFIPDDVVKILEK